MKGYILFLLLVIMQISVYAQNLIPEKITTDLVLSPQKKPYESTGFTVEVGATLTIMPGTKIIDKLGKETKGFSKIIINGTLIIGAKGTAKSLPVIFDSEKTIITFNSAKAEINGWDVTSTKIEFAGDNSGNFKNVNFYRDNSYQPYEMDLTVPKTGKLVFTDCLIEDMGIDIKSSDFPNDLDKLVITKCAFTSRSEGHLGIKLKKHLMPSKILAYGTKCDSYIDIEFTPFDWALKNALTSEWYISDERIRKTTTDSSKSLKSLSLKLTTKALTNYKQEDVPHAKDEKKK